MAHASGLTLAGSLIGWRADPILVSIEGMQLVKFCLYAIDTPSDLVSRKYYSLHGTVYGRCVAPLDNLSH